MSERAKDIVAEVVACALAFGVVWSLLQVVGILGFALIVVLLALALIELEEKELKYERSSKGTEDRQRDSGSGS